MIILGGELNVTQGDPAERIQCRAMKHNPAHFNNRRGQAA